MAVVGGVGLATNFGPVSFVEGGETGVAIVGFVDLGQVERCGNGQGHRIDFGAANHKNFLIVYSLRGNNGVVERMHDCNAVGLKGQVSGNHDISAIGQRLAETIQRLAAHDDGVVTGFALEIRGIVG